MSCWKSVHIVLSDARRQGDYRICWIKKQEGDDSMEVNKDVKSVGERVAELRELVYLQDITSPTVPEYIEHHESIKLILKYIDEQLMCKTITAEKRYRITSESTDGDQETHYVYCTTCEKSSAFAVLVDKTITVVFNGPIYSVEECKKDART